MASIAAVLIVKNEDTVIEECLKSVAWADEIIVLDSGSTDKTLDIARQYTDKVFQNSDWQGFGVQRQRAQAKVTSDWVLMIDADERVSDELRESLKAKLYEDDRSKAYALAILPWCFGRFIRHGGWYPAHKVRFYPLEKAHYGDQRVHEKLEFSPDIAVEKLNGDLLHYTYRDLEHYLVKSAHYAAEWANQREASGKITSLSQGVIHGLGCFIRMYVFRAGFLDGKQGLLLAVLSAHSTFVKYADLWVRYQQRDSRDQ